MNNLHTMLGSLQDYPWAITALQIAALLLVVFLAALVTRSLLMRAMERVLRAAPSVWGKALLGQGVISRLAEAVPALVLYYGVGLLSGVSVEAVTVVRALAGAYVVLTIAWSIGNLLNALGVIYVERNPQRAQARPIKGYLQVVKIIVYLVSVILIIAVLFDRDPLLLLSGLGALTAVLMLVFKDTLLSLVASVQLSSNDMLRVGDWIEMPQLNADGSVIDISLHTVKVQNWDRTITTIPTWRLISESYKNWRGMFDSGGRQMKRSLYLDQASVRFLADTERGRLRRFALIRDYLDRKLSEIAEYNSRLVAEGKDPVNSRAVTNVGTFRAYVQAYIEAHPGINKDMLMLVRQLQPQPKGLPLEIYCYTATTAWDEYEAIQADIFDHLYAILPEFGLRVFQEPSGADIRDALAAATAHAA